MTGSLAGQMVLDGFLGLRLPLLVRRALTMIPAVVVLALGVGEVATLVWSQVVLCLVLPIAAWSLVRLTSDKSVMGAFANGPAHVQALVLVRVILIAPTEDDHLAAADRHDLAVAIVELDHIARQPLTHAGHL